MFKLTDFNAKTQQQIRRQLADDVQPRHSGTVAVMESNPGDAPLEAEEVQRPISARFLVRVTSVRKRLLDEDNLCPKYYCDLLRYAGVIPDDSPELVEIQVAQRKVKKGEAEFVHIEVI